MPTLENGYEADFVKKIRSRKKRRCYMPRKKLNKLPRKEEEVRNKISAWCSDSHPKVEVQGPRYEKLVEKSGKKKVIDASLIGRYKHKPPSGAEGCIIAELEFEEHKQKKYSILEDMTEITIVLRKLDYWRHDIPQYFIKIDRDGTPFMINFRYIYENRNKLVSMSPYKQYTSHEQITRIVAAERKNKDAKWPKYVIIGWEKILKELNRVVKLAGF